MDSDRGFSAGSRQAPDPHDQYLERENYYRKHTPRDASSLFRCISEQLFDTQHYFRRVRDECCAYMRRNRDYFESHVDGDFDEYMQNMQHFRTRGTLLELRALAYRYRRNVLLFEPYTLGNSFIQQAQYGPATFLVFVAPDYHFDTVYTREQIEDAAYAQSVVYDTLYNDVFQLPDVGYAVERMLHDQLGSRLTAIEATAATEEEDDEKGEENGEKTNSLDSIAVGAVTENGRSFVFDGNKTSTRCILEDYRMCHFHNAHFAEYLDAQQAAGDAANNKRRIEDSMLKVGDVSCVRQLLNSGITPFPYKVAKALDPHIYRNIEFDVWSEMRKMARSKYLYRRYIAVGDKCIIRLNDENEPVTNKNAIAAGGGGDVNDDDEKNKNKIAAAPGKVYVGYVQYIEKYSNLYHVYVEELGERLVVQSNTLRACPPTGNDSRNFTVIGLNGGGRVFNKYREPFNRYQHRQGYYSPPYGARPYLSRSGNNNGNVRGSGGGGATAGYRQHYPYAYQNRYGNNNNKRFSFNARNDANNEDEEDMVLLKKKAAIIGTDPFHGELSEKKGGLFEGNNNNNPQVNLKELLCSTYYYAESAKYFQCNDIIAMPAFVTTDKENDEQRQNAENLKRNNNNGGENQEKSGNGGDYDQFNSDNNNKTNQMSGLELPTAGEQQQQQPQQQLELPVGIVEVMGDDHHHHQQQPPQLNYEQYQVAVSEGMVSGADPNAVYAAVSTTGGGGVGVGQQFYTGATQGSGTTYYMPAAAMDMGSTYYQPLYRNAVGSEAAATTPYYCNYVYSNATGAMQTVTPYLVTSGSGGANGNYNGYSTAVPFDGQMIPMQTAIRRRDLLCSETPINLNATPSYSVKGNDLPTNDIGSLRFYYNLGVQCFGYLASMQGAMNALNCLQYGENRQPGLVIAGEEATEISGAGTPSQLQSPSISGTPSSTGNRGDLGQEMRSLSIDGGSSVNKRHNSTSSEVAANAQNTCPPGAAGGGQPTRNSTPSSSSVTTSQGEANSSSAATTTTTVSSGGNTSHPGRNFQGPGYRRPPFNNHNNQGNTRGGGYGGGGGPGRHQYNNYNNNRSGMQQSSSSSSSSHQQNQQQQGGGPGGDKGGKDGRGGYYNNNNNNYNNYNNYGGYNNRRNGGGPGTGGNTGGRFNNNNNYNNNSNMNHRKPLNNSTSNTGATSTTPTAGSVSSVESNRTNTNNTNNIPVHQTPNSHTTTANADEKGGQSSPFTLNNQRHGQSDSPAGKGHHYGNNTNDTAIVSAVGNNDQQQQQFVGGQQPLQLHTTDEGQMYSVVGGGGGGGQEVMMGGGQLINQMPSNVGAIPMGYFGATSGQQIPFSGPPPHLPPPFGGSSNGGNQAAMVNQQQLMSMPPMANLQQQQQQQGYNASPFYTYATYYPVDMVGQGVGAAGVAPGGLLTTAGDSSAMTANGNMIIQSIPYMAAPSVSPYQTAPLNQHMMGAAAVGQQHQLATATNAPMYYTQIQGAEPVTPVMQAGPTGVSWAQDSMAWSSTTGATPGGNTQSGPSSGIGSTESSPPYGGSSAGGGGGVGGQGGGVIYANQSPAYNYSYPPPQHRQQQQQQQFWYAAAGAAAQPQQQATVLGGPPGGGVAVGNGGGGTPVLAKGGADGKP